MKLFVGAKIGRYHLGFEYAPIVHKDHGPYMTRWILHLVFFNLRLHQFFRGDMDRASHTHPWWFITIPFTPYFEHVYTRGQLTGERIVAAWKPQYRAQTFEHKVICPVVDEKPKTVDGPPLWFPSKKPFWTFVIAGMPGRVWGFWTPDGVFHPYGDE